MLKCSLLVIMLAIQGNGEECLLGKYGETCEEVCSPNCAPSPTDKSVYCHKLTGKCSEGCKSGWHGDRCNKKCSKNCLKGVCNVYNGACMDCEVNYSGYHCETYTESGQKEGENETSHAQEPASTPLAAILVPVFTMLIIIIIITVTMYRKRRRSKQAPSTDTVTNLLNTDNPQGSDQQDRATSNEEESQPKLIYVIYHTPATGSEEKRRTQWIHRKPDIQATGSEEKRRTQWIHRKPDIQVDTDLLTQDTDLHVACMEGNLQVVRDILDQSPEDINKKGCGGMTPLMWAARRGHREVVDLLVRKEADLKLKDRAGNNILHWACYGGHVALVKHVISENMVDIDSKGQGGRTPLMWAAQEGRGEFFEILVSTGGLLSHVDKEGNNILLLACSGGNVEIVESILSHADDNLDIDGRGLSGRTPLMVAAYKGCGNIFELLVIRGANQELADDVNDNVFHLACRGGNVDIVCRVLELGKVDKNSRGQCSRTPLMVAARLGHKEIFHLLVSEGADASLLDCENNNILHLACEGGRIDMVEYVLSLDTVNINARNKRNETATMLATKGGEVFNLLVSHGGLSK